jgi:EpsI family protein
MMRSGRFDFRFLVVVLLLLSTALLLQTRSGREVIAPRQSLADFPRSLGLWTSTEMTLDAETLAVLGPGDFLLREYQAASDVPVDLFIAYFPSQRTGDTIHSPKHCLPGAGWQPTDSSRISLSFPGRPPFMANRYLIARGEDRQLVLYWYQAHDRMVASEYWAKFYLIADAIRMNRSDGSLIRLSTPLVPRETSSSAEDRAVALAAQVVPHLDNYIPR